MRASFGCARRTTAVREIDHRRLLMKGWLVATALCAIGGTALADVDPQILDALKKVKAKDYPNANTNTVLNDQAVVYQLDGQFSNTQHDTHHEKTPTDKTEAASSSLYYAK